MLPRVIPVLLLQNGGLVKTKRFKDPHYVGDPCNTIKIFNDKEVDEIIVLDIEATVSRRRPNLSLLQEMTSECFIPLAYGGGIHTLADMEALFTLGVEKVILNAAAFAKPDIIIEAAVRFGSQAIVVCLDVRKNWLGQYQVCTHRGSQSRNGSPAVWAKRMALQGAGEIMLQSIDRDGMGVGYDLALTQQVANAVDVPVIACGGAGNLQHLQAAITAGASAVAAGSFFVFYGQHRAVLITYPSRDELEATFSFAG